MRCESKSKRVLISIDYELEYEWLRRRMEDILNVNSCSKVRLQKFNNIIANARTTIVCYCWWLLTSCGLLSIYKLYIELTTVMIVVGQMNFVNINFRSTIIKSFFERCQVNKMSAMYESADDEASMNSHKHSFMSQIN